MWWSRWRFGVPCTLFLLNEVELTRNSVHGSCVLAAWGDGCSACSAGWAGGGGGKAGPGLDLAANGERSPDHPIIRINRIKEELGRGRAGPGPGGEERAGAGVIAGSVIGWRRRFTLHDLGLLTTFLPSPKAVFPNNLLHRHLLTTNNSAGCLERAYYTR